MMLALRQHVRHPCSAACRRQPMMPAIRRHVRHPCGTATTHLEAQVNWEPAAGICQRVPAAAGLALKQRHLGAIPAVRGGVDGAGQRMVT